MRHPGQEGWPMLSDGPDEMVCQVCGRRRYWVDGEWKEPWLGTNIVHVRWHRARLEVFLNGHQS